MTDGTTPDEPDAGTPRSPDGGGDRGPVSPRDHAWWAEFGEALFTGDFSSDGTPETRETIMRLRSGLRDVAASAGEMLTDGGVARILDRLTAIEERLAAIERRLDSDQRTTPMA